MCLLSCIHFRIGTNVLLSVYLGRRMAQFFLSDLQPLLYSVIQICLPGHINDILVFPTFKFHLSLRGLQLPFPIWVSWEIFWFLCFFPSEEQQHYWHRHWSINITNISLENPSSSLDIFTCLLSRPCKRMYVCIKFTDLECNGEIL